MFAHVVEQVVKVQEAQELPDGVGVLVTALDGWCDEMPHEVFARQPAALYYNGRVYGKSAFDSDRNVAFYRTDVALAEVQLLVI